MRKGNLDYCIFLGDITNKMTRIPIRRYQFMDICFSIKGGPVESMCSISENSLLNWKISVSKVVGFFKSNVRTVVSKCPNNTEF